MKKIRNKFSRNMKYYHTKRGTIIKIYNSQIASSKRRKHPLPAYSRDDFITWVLDQNIFHKLHAQWVESNYERMLAPSIDRLDDSKSYTFDNIRITTWKENNQKYACSKLGIKSLEQYIH